MKFSFSATDYPHFLPILILLLFFASITNSQIITPEDHFGFVPGTKNHLVNYQPMIDYLKLLEKNSPKIKMQKIGKSSLGKDMYIAFISSAENLINLNKLKKYNRELALNPYLEEEEKNKMLIEGKVFFLATLSMHSNEVAPSQSAANIAYQLVTSNDAETNEWLNNVVYMMVPCHNPDGMDMIVDHYNKYKGTKYDGSSMPGIYHKYVGHNINRDFVSLTQAENKAIARIYNLDWFPQVMVEKHQMGSTGPRYYVPPNHDPIAENVDAGIWNWNGIFGSNIIKDLTQQGLSGVCQHYIFDNYWPGSTETCIWKNVIGFLTEAASAKYATPIFVEPTELAVYGKGLSEYKKSVNMPLPWKGGWWELKDIVDYEIASTMSILKTASVNRIEILKYRNELCKREVERGKNEAPYYYIFPQKQHDKSELVHIVNLMIEHGVNVYSISNDITIRNTIYKKGDVVIPLTQAFRPFIKEVMETQKFPARHYTPDGEMIKPYDITSWSLPLHNGVKSIEINHPSDELSSCLLKIEDSYSLNKNIPTEYSSVILNANFNESYKAAFTAMSKDVEVNRTSEETIISGKTIPKGSFLIGKSTELDNLISEMKVEPIFLFDNVDIKTEKVKVPNIALVETYFHDMDAGWTRYLFDNYDIPYSVLRPGDIEETDLSKFDVVVFPDSRKSILMSGKYQFGGESYIPDTPPKYTKGIGTKGLEKIMTFVNNGGTILSWGNSTEIFMGEQKIKLNKDETETFKLPIKNISSGLSKKGLYIPGSLVKIKLLKDHPITLGMENEIGVFYRGNPVFSTSIPGLDMDRRVLGAFPEDKILLSGYAENEKMVGNKAGLVWLKKGKGQMVFFAFCPQFRGSTSVSYKLLFNSLLLPKL